MKFFRNKNKNCRKKVIFKNWSTLFWKKINNFFKKNRLKNEFFFPFSKQFYDIDAFMIIAKEQTAIFAQLNKRISFDFEISNVWFRKKFKSEKAWIVYF